MSPRADGPQVRASSTSTVMENWTFLSRVISTGRSQRIAGAVMRPDISDPTVIRRCFTPATHILYHNNGDGTFTDVTRRPDWPNLAGNGLGVAINDFDGDGWPDIIVANDARPQQMFRNNRDGTFTDIAVRTGLAYDEDGKAYSGMGIAFEDYNNDGRPDVLITNLAWQRYAAIQQSRQRRFRVCDTVNRGRRYLNAPFRMGRPVY